MAPRVQMDARRARQVVLPRGGVQLDVEQRPRNAVLKVHLPVRLKIGPQGGDADRGGEDETASDRAEAFAEPLARPHRGRGQHRHRRQDEQVDRRQRLQHEPSGEGQRVARPRRTEQGVERRQREREKLDMQRLQMGQTGQGVRVERRRDAGDAACGPAAGPPRRHEARRPPGQGEARQQHQVVDEQRRCAQPQQRRAEDALDQHGLREGQRIALGKEDVRVEEVQRIADDLVRDPRDGPLVEHRVAVVVARQASRGSWRAARCERRPAARRRRMSPGGGEAAPQPSMAREAAATSSSRPGRPPAAPLLRGPIRGCGSRAASTPAPVPATAARREPGATSV